MLTPFFVCLIFVFYFLFSSAPKNQINNIVTVVGCNYHYAWILAMSLINNQYIYSIIILNINNVIIIFNVFFCWLVKQVWMVDSWFFTFSMFFKVFFYMEENCQVENNDKNTNEWISGFCLLFTQSLPKLIYHIGRCIILSFSI